jgi:hypothetical protein
VEGCNPLRAKGVECKPVAFSDLQNSTRANSADTTVVYCADSHSDTHTCMQASCGCSSTQTDINHCASVSLCRTLHAELLASSGEPGGSCGIHMLCFCEVTELCSVAFSCEMELSFQLGTLSLPALAHTVGYCSVERALEGSSAE